MALVIGRVIALADTAANGEPIASADHHRHGHIQWCAISARAT